MRCLESVHQFLGQEGFELGNLQLSFAQLPHKPWEVALEQSDGLCNHAQAAAF